MAYLSGGSITWGSSPKITFTAEYEVSRNVSQVTITVRVLTSSVSGYSYFGYYINTNTYLNGSWAGSKQIKGNSPSQWSAYYTTLGTFTTTVSDLSQTALPVEIVFSTNSSRSNTSLTFSAILPNLAPSTTSEPTFDIGKNLTVTINRQSPDFIHSLELYAEGTKLATAESVGLSYTFDLSDKADTLYALCPDAAYAATSLICKTYNGSTLIGTSTATGQARVTNSNPIFSDFTIATDSTTQTLTGNSTTLIGGYSGVTVIIPTSAKATAQNGASMSSYSITNGEQTASKAYSSGAAVTASLSNVKDLATTVAAVDSRGLQTAVTKTLTQLAYSPPVLATASAKRDNDIDATVKLTLTGTVFSGSFGAADNAITITWRWKRVTSDTWNTGTTKITPTVSDSGELSYSGYITNASNTWYIEQAYDLEISISDKIATGTAIYCTINVGVPGIYMTKSGDKYSVGIGKKPDTQYALDVNGDANISGTIAVDGGTVPSIVEQGTSGIWTYRKWSDGTAECWGTVTCTSVKANTAWGSIYESDWYGNINYPLTFTERPTQTMNISRTTGYSFWLECPSGSKCNTTTNCGQWIFLRPVSLSSTITAYVDIQVKGKWK